ncbi:hypothetical protein B0H13DRAFT_1923190 [Mycena leptocephala]|nr:hypothetical protein B0H13DRAFT_1923190 [Mycena leptocephala]
MSDQCAPDANGNLKDASEIDFYESESDTKALAAKSTVFAAEKADDDGNPFIDAPKRSRAKANRVKLVPESVSDEEDDDFELPDLIDPSDSEGSDDEMDVDNDEIASLLQFKTVPSRSKSSKTQTRATSGKRKHTSDSASAPATKKTRNPVYLFYEVVTKNSLATRVPPAISTTSAFTAIVRSSPFLRPRALTSANSSAI